MFHSIRRRDEAVRTKGPRELLLDCHGRIRIVLSVAARLYESSDAPSGEVREAATRITRYFASALPLHEEDEEISLAARLTAESASLAPSLRRMAEEHARIHEELDVLMPLWSELEQSPERLADLVTSLAEPTRALTKLFDEHLAHEESVLFPAIDALADDVKTTLVEEMRARRQYAFS